MFTRLKMIYWTNYNVMNKQIGLKQKHSIKFINQYMTFIILLRTVIDTNREKDVKSFDFNKTIKINIVKRYKAFK